MSKGKMNHLEDTYFLLPMIPWYTDRIFAQCKLK